MCKTLRPAQCEAYMIEEKTFNHMEFSGTAELYHLICKEILHKKFLSKLILWTHPWSHDCSLSVPETFTGLEYGCWRLLGRIKPRIRTSFIETKTLAWSPQLNQIMVRGVRILNLVQNYQSIALINRVCACN
jgi:hypothetical protein